MKNPAVHFSSASGVWSTPDDFFAALDRRFHFTLDVCALPENAKCDAYFSPEVDGLAQDWTGVCWLNPPYGNEIARWVKKAFETARAGAATVVCLLPARTDTRWFHDYCVHGEVEFVRGRLKFGGSPNPAPFPNMVVVFRARVTYRAPELRDGHYYGGNAHEVMMFVGPQPPCETCGGSGECEGWSGPIGCGPCNSRLIVIRSQAPELLVDWGDTVERLEDGTFRVIKGPD